MPVDEFKQWLVICHCVCGVAKNQSLDLSPRRVQSAGETRQIMVKNHLEYRSDFRTPRFNVEYHTVTSVSSGVR